MNTDYLVTLYNTLDDIEVKGEANLEKMLGSIRAVKQMIQQAQNSPVAEPEQDAKKEC